MYIESIYRLEWKILNIFAGRGAGKTFTASQLIKQANNLGLKTGTIFRTKESYKYISEKYFPEINANIAYFPQDLKADNLDKDIDLLWVEEPAENLSLSQIEKILEFSENLKGRIITTNGYFGCSKKEIKLITAGKDKIESHYYVHNVFIYPKTVLQELLSGKLIGHIYKEKNGLTIIN